MPVITNAGEYLITQQQQAGQPLIIDKMILANITGLDSNAKPSRAEGMPAPADVKIIKPITKDGLLNSNTVVYSTVFPSTDGTFDFNWMGLYSSAHDVVVGIAYVPLQTKIKTVGTDIGNVITKNFAIEFNAAADITGINISAESWQIDYTARLMSMDKHQRDLVKNIYGRSTFLNDAFKVKHDTGKYYLSAGKAILGGINCELETDLEVVPGTLPATIWLDVYQETSMVGVLNKYDVVVNDGTALPDYNAGSVEHTLVKLGVVNSSVDIVDGRSLVKNSLELRTKKDEVASIAELRNTEPEYPGQKIHVTSYYDGWAATGRGPDGGGIFYYDENDSSSLDDGGFCIVSGGLKRWKRDGYTVSNSVDFGADRSGVLASDDAINAAFIHAMKNGISHYTPGGFYAIEKGIDLIQTGVVTGDSVRVDCYGDGKNSTIFFSRGAPLYTVKVDGRYVTFRSFGIWGSVDEIRDSTNSSSIGLEVEDMRIGAISDFRIAHVVGAGLRINKTIITNISDGVVYRCGSDVSEAVAQVNSNQDGFQASTFKNINVEDSHGSAGAISFLSHLNSDFGGITVEQQPYYIAELSNPVGVFNRDEAVSFSGGASGFVALRSKNSSDYINAGRGEIIVRDLVGDLSTATGTVSTSSGSGTVTCVTKSGGQQFKSSGDHGNFDGLWFNQNRLRDSGVEVEFSGSDNTVPGVKIRGEHKGTALTVSGDRNSFGNVYIEQNINEIANISDYLDSVVITGNSNTFEKLRTNNSKGITESGGRTTINFLKCRLLYGKSAVLGGVNSEITNIDTLMANYVDSGGVLNGPHVNISGLNSKILGGSISATLSATDVIQLSGVNSKAVLVDILDAGSANSVIRTTSLGVGASVLECTIDVVPDGSKGINLTAENSKAKGNIIAGGAISLSIVNSGCSAIDNECSGFSVRGIDGQPSTVKRGLIISENNFHSAAGATHDISLNNNITDSQIITNNGARGVGANSLGSGAGNVTVNNV